MSGPTQDGDDELARDWAAWLEDKTPALRDTAAKWPPGTSFDVHGTPMYVVTYTDGGSVSLSYTDPSTDYEAAMATRQKVCDCCKHRLEGLMIKRGL